MGIKNVNPNSVLYCSSKMKIKIPQYIHIFLGQYISTIRKRIGTNVMSMENSDLHSKKGICYHGNDKMDI